MRAMYATPIFAISPASESNFSTWNQEWIPCKGTIVAQAEFAKDDERHLFISLDEDFICGNFLSGSSGLHLQPDRPS